MARTHNTRSRPDLHKKNENVLASASHDGGPVSIYHPFGSIDILGTLDNACNEAPGFSVGPAADTCLWNAPAGQTRTSMGAEPARSFTRVILPLVMPGVLIAAVLCFILGMNAFATPLLLGGPRFQMMAPLLYWEFSSNNNWPFTGVLAFVLMGSTLALTLAASAVIPRRYRVR